MPKNSEKCSLDAKQTPFLAKLVTSANNNFSVGVSCLCK
jgi:hypothetical protein